MSGPSGRNITTPPTSRRDAQNTAARSSAVSTLRSPAIASVSSRRNAKCATRRAVASSAARRARASCKWIWNATSLVPSTRARSASIAKGARSDPCSSTSRFDSPCHGSRSASSSSGPRTSRAVRPRSSARVPDRRRSASRFTSTMPPAGSTASIPSGEPSTSAARSRLRVTSRARTSAGASIAASARRKGSARCDGAPRLSCARVSAPSSRVPRAMGTVT